MTTAIQRVLFDGDQLDVIGSSREDAMVVLRPACEALGLDHRAQIKRLQRQPWAVVSMMDTTGADGKRYEMFCVSLDTVPMWLATIETNRVRPEVREKLTRYQREAAHVLANHFAPRVPQAPQTQQTPQAFVFPVEAIQALVALGPMLTSIALRLDSLEERVANGVPHFIPWSAKKQIDSTLTAIGKARALERGTKPSSERMKAEHALRSLFDFPKSVGRGFTGFPLRNWERMEPALQALEREAQDTMRRLCQAKQLPFVFGDPTGGEQ